ncbi:hypothetical protein Dimus_038070 [Dionaea muscipula]
MLCSPTSCMAAARTHDARRLQTSVLAQGARRLLLVLMLAAARGAPSPSYCSREVITMRGRSSPEAFLLAARWRFIVLATRWEITMLPAAMELEVLVLVHGAHCALHPSPWLLVFGARARAW